MTLYDEIVQNIEQGHKLEEIARLHQCCQETIRRECIKHGSIFNDLKKKILKQQTKQLQLKATSAIDSSSIHTNPPTRDDPPRDGSHGGERLTLPDDLQTLIHLAPQIPNWASPLVLEWFQSKRQSKGFAPYRRPFKFSEKQHLISNYIVHHLIKFLFVVGAQRGGKTTSIFNALTELVLMNTTGRPLQFDLMCGKGKQAERILRNVYHDQIIYENNRAQIPQLLSTYCMWADGSRLDCHETTVGDIKGADSDVVWIDEFDVAIKKDALAVQTAINTCLANPNMIIIMSSNQDQGMYQYIKQKFEEFAIGSTKFAFVEIFPDDCPWVKESGNLEAVTEVSNLLVGETTTKMRLQNIFTGSGDQFPSDAIQDAYDIYETLMNTSFKSEKPITECDLRIISIDPSNTGHPFGWMLLGVKDQHLIEFKGDMFQMGMDATGQKWSTDRINEFFLKLYRENYCRCVLLENNSYGGGLMTYLQNRGVKVEISVRGKEGADNSLSNFINVARKVFEDRLIALKNPDLRGQLTIYDPLERGKADNQFKGDIADALINGIWYIVGGLKYMAQTTLQTQEQKVAWY